MNRIVLVLVVLLAACGGDRASGPFSPPTIHLVHDLPITYPNGAYYYLSDPYTGLGRVLAYVPAGRSVCTELPPTDTIVAIAVGPAPSETGASLYTHLYEFRPEAAPGWEARLTSSGGVVYVDVRESVRCAI